MAGLVLEIWKCVRFLVLGEVNAGGTGESQSAECLAAGANPREIH